MYNTKKLFICVFYFLIVFLFVACGRNPEEARKELEQKGIEFSETELLNRIGKNDIEAVKLFIEAGVDINKPILDVTYALAFAIGTGQLEMVKFLIENGAGVNSMFVDSSTGYYMSPLMVAAATGNLEIVKFLIKKGADVNVKNCQFTPLHLAVYSDQLEVAKFLIKKGADVNAIAIDGSTPLMNSKIRGSEDMYKILKKAGAKEY